MKFSELHNELKSLFSLEKLNIPLSGTNSAIRMMRFTSVNTDIPGLDTRRREAIEGYCALSDREIAENRQFLYPVFVPDIGKKYSKAIILLHGLNERNWVKYLTWAYYLMDKTGKPVILFPIAFHMNRSPLNWANPRSVLPLLNMRKKNSKMPDMTTVANVALSERLSEDPLRFFASGRQSCGDIVSLFTQMKEGKHPLFFAGTEPDFFTYSIGSFLGEILFIANPNNLFSNSKMFMFCGGALFSQMNGVSRLIMDEAAFKSINHYYLDEFQKEMENSSPLSDYVLNTDLGNSFYSMIKEESLRKYRNHAFTSFRKRIYAISLIKDRVIPSAGIVRTLSGGKNSLPENVEVLNPAYDYTHETPFPVGNISLMPEIDATFERVFGKAASFLQ